MAFACLVTPEMMKTMPKEIEVLRNFGQTTAVFPDENNKVQESITGDHCIIQVKDENHEILKEWLRPFDGIAVTQGSPMAEQFKIMHIK